MTQPSYDSTRPRSNLPIILVVALLVAGTVAWYLWFSAQPTEIVTAPAPSASTAPDSGAGGVAAPPPAVEVIEDLEADDALDEWLAVPGIVQRVAAATWRVSNGDSPSPVLGFLTLSGRFDVIEEDDTLYIDPKSYRRYDAIVDRIVAVDPEHAGKAYRRLRPNFESAFLEIAEPGQKFHDVAKKAVQRVLAVEVPTGKLEVVEKGATFFYADESLESLAPADKHVLRLGPKNAKRVKAWLRKMARAAGVL